MIFVKELEKYNINYLKSIFLNDSSIIEYLISKKILIKYDSGFYSFDYVGILLYKDEVIFSLPKYTQKSNYKDKAVKLLQLFGQYTKREKLEEEELETFGAIDSTTSYNMQHPKHQLHILYEILPYENQHLVLQHQKTNLQQ